MMTPAELDGFRQQLHALGQRLKGDVSHLATEALRNAGGRESGSLSNTPVHLADLGTDAFEQEVSLCLLENQEQQLEDVAAALRRMEAGKFGRCEACAGEIGQERLQALPYARFCIDCAQQTENPR
jgi:RNA polymerase-binding transcription factor DksA